LATAKTTIELNGKLYDARSGRIIDEMVSAVTAKRTTAQTSQGTVLDGFVRRTSPAVNAAVGITELPPAQATKTTSSKASKSVVSRAAPAHAKAKLQKSQTLMRPAVKKPKPEPKNDVTLHKAAVVKKLDPQRQIRAVAVPKSNHVKRFNHSAQHTTIVRKHAVMPVAIQGSLGHAQIADQVAHLATSTEAHVHNSVNIIEESLRQATSHLETFEDKLLSKSFWHRVGFRNKTANLATVGLTGFLLFGFFAYQNVPNVEMRVAAARSGVSAHMPGYHPAGFGVARGIQAEPGKVAVTFRSNTDDRNYTVTQQASNWSSDSLLTNHVLASKKPYQTYQDAGKTVYIQENASATWVNGGVWYKVDGNASLTSDQLLRIANSL
jgi:hypothetical protein